MPKAEGNIPRKPQYEPAPPDYGNEPPYMDDKPEGMTASVAGGEMINKLIPIGISILVAIVLVGVFFSPVNKKVYQSDITRLETDLVAMRNVETSLGNKITALETANAENLNVINDAVSKATNDIEAKAAAVSGSLTDYAKKDELASLSSDLAEAKNNLNTLQATVTNFKLPPDVTAEIKSLQDKIIDLTKQIKDLEDEVANIEVTSSSKEPSVELEQISNFTLNNPTGFTGGYLYEATFKLIIENNSDNDITIQELFISVFPNPTGTITQVSLVDLSGKTFWASVDSRTPMFYSYKDIEVNDNDTDRYTLRITIITSDNASLGAYETEIELEDWIES